MLYITRVPGDPGSIARPRLWLQSGPSSSRFPVRGHHAAAGGRSSSRQLANAALTIAFALAVAAVEGSPWRTVAAVERHSC